MLEQSSCEAMFQLGKLYSGPVQHFTKAETYYQMAAEDGHVQAMVALADLYNYQFLDDKKAGNVLSAGLEKG